MTDDLRPARGILIGAIIGGIMYAVFVICAFILAGVVEW